MIYTIKNNLLEAHISSNGAELIQLIDQSGNNRMHIPSTNTWDEVSPVLFPQVSRVRDDVYCVAGKEYKMGIHGFAKKMDINPCEIKGNKIVFKIKDNEETKKVYPYEFEFTITYELIDNSLKVTFKTLNTGKDVLRYMVGGHPGFELPINEFATYEDYKIVFERKETSRAMQVVGGYLAHQYVDYLKDEDSINLKHDLFVPDAIVLTDLTSKYCDIISKDEKFDIRFHFSDFEILAIWSLNNDDANYVCLEPWNGIPKQYVKNHEEMGVLELNPGEYKEYSYSIEIIK